MSFEIVGHAIVSGDGRIADIDRRMPPELRNDTDWRRFQAALDRAAMVVLGRLGHEMHPNPGRRRLVVTSRVERLERVDELMTLWNPAGLDFRAAATELGALQGTIAVTGGQAVFDLFLPLFTRFDLAIVDGVLLPHGVLCFSRGWPDEVLARAGLRVAEREMLDPGVRLEVWRR
ncbi:MAG: dihydrofolate reductase [Devosia sp.]